MHNSECRAWWQYNTVAILWRLTIATWRPIYDLLMKWHPPIITSIITRHKWTITVHQVPCQSITWHLSINLTNSIHCFSIYTGPYLQICYILHVRGRDHSKQSPSRRKDSISVFYVCFCNIQYICLLVHQLTLLLYYTARERHERH